MISYPRFDPAVVAVHDSAEAEKALTFLNAAPGKPLLANAYQERYMPGSSFKVITTVDRLRERRDVARPRVPERDGVHTAADHRPDPELRRHRVRRLDGRGLLPQLQHPVRPVGPRRRAGEDGRRAPRSGASARSCRSTCPAPAASSFGEVADFTDNLPLLAIGGFGQGSDHDGAVAHGDGRQHGRQRRA